MVLCQYVIISGARKGEYCNRVIKTPGSNYCYAHKNHSARQDKYADKIEVIRKNKQDSDMRFEEDVKRSGGRATKKAMEDEIYKSLKEQYIPPTLDESSEESEETYKEPVKQPVIKKPKEETNPEDLSDTKLADELTRLIKIGNTSKARLYLNELKARGIVDDEEYKIISGKL